MLYKAALTFPSDCSFFLAGERAGSLNAAFQTIDRFADSLLFFPA